MFEIRGYENDLDGVGWVLTTYPTKEQAQARLRQLMIEEPGQYYQINFVAGPARKK